MTIEEQIRTELEVFEKDFEFRLEYLLLEITEKIVASMERKGINRSELAERLEVSPAAVTKVLNGTSNFTLKTLLSLADALDQSLFVDFQDTKKAKSKRSKPLGKR